MSVNDGAEPDLRPAPPAAALEARVRGSVGAIAPVKPLLPPFARAAIALALGVGLVLALAAPIADGEPRRAGAALLAGVAAAGFWLAMRLAVPGTPAPRALALASFAVPALVAAAALGRFGAGGGVHGVACLVLGVAIALLPLVAAMVLVARAFPVAPVLTGGVAGLSAGALGLALLTLNCPVREGPHLAIFHAGVLVLSLAVGALAGRAAAPR